MRKEVREALEEGSSKGFDIMKNIKILLITETKRREIFEILLEDKYYEMLEH